MQDIEHKIKEFKSNLTHYIENQSVEHLNKLNYLKIGQITLTGFFIGLFFLVSVFLFSTMDFFSAFIGFIGLGSFSAIISIFLFNRIDIIENQLTNKINELLPNEKILFNLADLIKSIEEIYPNLKESTVDFKNQLLKSLSESNYHIKILAIEEFLNAIEESINNESNTIKKTELLNFLSESKKNNFVLYK